MTGREATSYHTCACGKRAFYSRKQARRWVRQMNCSSSGMSVYECKHVPGYWHFGHAPSLLVRGVITRDQVMQQKRGHR
jgi:hypothetical protein